MRIVVMGTGPFALPTCRRLLQDGHDVPLVVTRPVADPSSKKQPLRPVFEWARAAGIEIFEPPSINAPEVIAQLSAIGADLFFVCDYGQILSNAALGAARLGGINLHGSLLPRHRGAAPVQWALLRGDLEAGVTVIHMTPRLDSGPALAMSKTQILPDETAEGLEPRLAELGVEACVKALDMLQHWDGVSPLGELQDSNLVTKAPRFAKSDGQLDFRKSATQLECQVRACQPWPGTFAELVWSSGKQMRLLIRSARGINSAVEPLTAAPVGKVASIGGGELDADQAGAHVWTPPWDHVLAVACGQGSLLISRVQPAGKREMSVDEFLRGHPIPESAQFTLASSGK